MVDLSFMVAPVHPYWGEGQHESLIVAFVFHFLNYRPWQLRGTPKMLAVVRQLSKVFQTSGVASRIFLRKFLLEIRAIPSLSSSMVWRLLYLGGRPPFPLSLRTDQEESHRGRNS